MEQVLINLIKNAFEAVEKIKKPEIKVIGTKGGGGKISLSVEDNGAGIATENLDNILDAIL